MDPKRAGDEKGYNVITLEDCTAALSEEEQRLVTERNYPMFSRPMNHEMHFLLFYHAVDDYVERRKPFRDAHLKYARQAVNRGELVLGGALADPADGAVLLFRELVL